MVEVLANVYNKTLSDGLHGIAIDNIKHEIVPDADHCPTMPVQAAVTTPAPQTTTTARPITTSPFAPSFDCRFDDGTFCGWTQRNEDTYKWLIGQKLSTGPAAGPVLGDNSQSRCKSMLGFRTQK